MKQTTPRYLVAVSHATLVSQHVVRAVVAGGPVEDHTDLLSNGEKLDMYTMHSGCPRQRLRQ